MPMLFLLFMLFVPLTAVRMVQSITSEVRIFMSWAPKVAIARLIAKWRSLLTIIAGVILGAGIGALIPLYVTAVAQVGLVQRMEEEPLHDTQVQFRISLQPRNFDDGATIETMTPEERAALVDRMVTYAEIADEVIVKSSVEAHFSDEHLEGWLEGVNLYTETDRFGLATMEGEPLLSTRASFIHLESWEERVTVLKGDLPSRVPVPDSADMNVAIGIEVANELGIRQGDILIVSQRIQKDGNNGGYGSSVPFSVYVSAIVTAARDNDPFWMGNPTEYLAPLTISTNGLWNYEFKFLTSTASVLEVATTYSPETPLDFGWRLLLNYEELSYVRISEARQALINFQKELQQSFFDLENPRDLTKPNDPSARINPRGSLTYKYHTRLVEFKATVSEPTLSNDEGILQDYEKKQRTNEGPLTLLLLQIGGLVLFFLMITAMLVRRGERREIAMFQSRGARGAHLLALRGIEGLIICVFGALIAPFIAQQVLIGLGPVVADTDSFPLPLTNRVFFFSFGASGIMLVALTLTLVPILRQPLISAGGAAFRSSKTSWWQRYYVDVMIVFIGLFVLIRLITLGDALIELEGSGDTQFDVLLLLAPTFLFFGLGSLALRTFPLVTAGLSSLAAGVSAQDVMTIGQWLKSRGRLFLINGLIWLGVGGLGIVLQNDLTLDTANISDDAVMFIITALGTVIFAIAGFIFWGIVIWGFILVVLHILLQIFAPRIAGFMANRQGMPATMALWQLSRESIHYARIAFLLSLAIAIGWFATSFRATVRSSQVDQAHYVVGADAVLMERDIALNVDRVRDERYYETIPNIESASEAYRIPRVNNNNVSSGSSAVGLLAIDPTTFGNVALESWREDLGNIQIPYLPEANLNLPVVGTPLPFVPEKIGFWARLDAGGGAIFEPNINQLTYQVDLGLRLQDDAGTWMLVPASIQRVEYLRCGEAATVTGDRPGFGARAHIPSGWAYVEADLTTLSPPSGNLRLVSVYWEYRAQTPNTVRLLFADMTLLRSGQPPQLVEIFESTNSNWRYLLHSGDTSGERVTIGRPVFNNLYNCDLDFNGVDSSFDNQEHDMLATQFQPESPRSRMGINLNYPSPLPLQGIISESIHEEDTIAYGENAPLIQLTTGQGTIIPVRPAAMTEYFPSLFNRDKFVIVDIRELLYLLNERPLATYYPNEIWLNFSDEIDNVDEATAIIDDLTGNDVPDVAKISSTTYQESFDALETDPLALGLLGLMFLAFAIALTLSIVGLLTYAALTAQERRGQLGVLRALGLSSTRVVFSLLYEQFFVVLIGGIIGSLLGYILSVLVVPTLAVGATGEGVVPPFITKTEWGAIGNFWLIMTVVLIVVFVFSFVVVRQLSLTRSLRLGEE